MEALVGVIVGAVLTSWLSAYQEHRRVFARTFEASEWPDARALFADQLDTEAFTVLSRGARSIERLHDYGSRFERQASPALLLPMRDVGMHADELKHASALLALLAEEDLRNPVVRLWHRWQRPPELAAVALIRYLQVDTGARPDRETGAAQSSDATGQPRAACPAGEADR